ncbi:O-antigen ligase family protein [Scytonema millei]|uniref:O-antigen ligase family protein n=1 Tax=Scytonema millei VB511283 TaxID=1245923 RepID=A0A9X5I752_9CYAN|nr:O-antigen ligase [Scytonema millei]NHC37424.1 O-antigen ligase family protein [Scytonema millei VB511283]
MKKKLVVAENIFATLSLLHYTSGPLSVIFTGGISEGELTTIQPDNTLIWFLFLLNYGISFLLLIARWKTTIYLLSKDKFIWVLVGVALISISWSFSPEMTLRRGIALLGTTAFGFYLATRYSLKQLLYLLSWVFGIAIFLSFFFGMVLPQYGSMGGIHAGAWRGIYPHKNTLGGTMVLSAIVFFLLAMDSKNYRFILGCGFLFSVVLVLLSTSKTSLTNLVFLVAAIHIYRTFRQRYEIMVPTLIAITIVSGSFYILLISNLDNFMGLLGKNATLTGRTDLWPAVVNKIQQRPWLGYGYSGFWSTDWTGESVDVWYIIGWISPNSHNGVLDLWLDLGLLGVLIFLIGFWKNLINGLAWIRQSKTSVSIFPLVYFTYIVLANLTENTLLVQNSIFWVLYVTISLLLIKLPVNLRNT